MRVFLKISWERKLDVLWLISLKFKNFCKLIGNRKISAVRTPDRTVEKRGWCGSMATPGITQLSILSVHMRGLWAGGCSLVYIRLAGRIKEHIRWFCGHLPKESEPATNGSDRSSFLTCIVEGRHCSSFLTGFLDLTCTSICSFCLAVGQYMILLN